MILTKNWKPHFTVLEFHKSAEFKTFFVFTNDIFFSSGRDVLKNIGECVFSVRRCAHFDLFTLAGNINNNQVEAAEKALYTMMHKSPPENIYFYDHSLL